jgi:prepilin-type N-terminal cleavage/methylation domain-containing protein
VKRNHAGFSLIELMVVVGIAGILASIAIPGYLGFQRRAKTAERKVVISSIMRDVTNTFQATGRWPWGVGPGTTTWNPPLPTGANPFSRAAWVKTDAAWQNVTFSSEQPLYCRYLVHTGVPDSVLYVDVMCDLDADGDRCSYSEGYNTATNAALNCQGATPDAECAGHTPASGQIFGDNDCQG